MVLLHWKLKLIAEIRIDIHWRGYQAYEEFAGRNGNDDPWYGIYLSEAIVLFLLYHSYHQIEFWPISCVNIEKKVFI